MLTRSPLPPTPPALYAPATGDTFFSSPQAWTRGWLARVERRGERRLRPGHVHDLGEGDGGSREVGVAGVGGRDRLFVADGQPGREGGEGGGGDSTEVRGERG